MTFRLLTPGTDSTVQRWVLRNACIKSWSQIKVDKIILHFIVEVVVEAVEDGVIIVIKFSNVGLKLSVVGGEVIVTHSKLSKGSTSGALGVEVAERAFQAIDAVFHGGKLSGAVLLEVRAELVQKGAFEEANYVASLLFLCAEGVFLCELDTKPNCEVAQLLSVAVELGRVSHTLAMARGCLEKAR